MRSLAVQQQTFNANRAVGRVALRVAAEGGHTRRQQVHEEGGLRVRFPNAGPRECEAVLVNTAGGIAGGDRFDIAIDVGAQARLSVCGAAAEKIYRTHGPNAQIALRLSAGEGAMLRWLPQETILFDRARVSRTIDVELAEGASLVLSEAVVFGRAAMGEAVQTGFLSDRWRVKVGGRLVFAETLKLGDAIGQTLVKAAVANGETAIATVLIVPGSDMVIDAVRALDDQFAGEVGISAWNGIAVVRLCACDGAALRHDLVMILGAAGQGVLPRLWMN
jgi:urease accessory protein